MYSATVYGEEIMFEKITYTIYLLNVIVLFIGGATEDYKTFNRILGNIFIVLTLISCILITTQVLTVIWGS